MLAHDDSLSCGRSSDGAITGEDGAGFCYPAGLLFPRRLAAPPVSLANFTRSAFNYRNAALAGRRLFILFDAEEPVPRVSQDQVQWRSLSSSGSVG